MQNMSITRQVLTLPAAYAKNNFNFVLLPQKKKKWSDEYLDFDIVVRHLKYHNRWFGEFDKISTEKKNKIFYIIKISILWFAI